MSTVYELSLLLSLKDAASGGLDRFQARLLAAGKDGAKYVKSLENMRSEMNKGIAMTGIGTAGLALMGKGVLVAGDFQAAMTELRASFSKVGADGKINMAALGGDMQRAEAVAIKMGNELPGTTEDFVTMMQALKVNGLGIETILNGAAEAVGNLAVATNSVPKEIAADFAKFGNLFKLRAEDFEPAADVFARIYSSTGQTSADLIEAAKYFQGRAGQNLGIGGLKDAEQMTRLFGLMGKNGMTGSMAGMGLTQFFESYGQHKDKLDDLEKATGIKLDFFDKDKKFVGMESVIEQMQQFNKLSTEDRTSWMSEMFGVLGMGAGNILANGEAWKKHNSEVNQAISLAQKKAEISKNFNNQLEALTGSVKNLVVTGFTPLLPALTSGAEGANKMVSAIIDFGKANPTLTGTVAKLALLGTTAVMVVGSIKTLYNAFGLMRFAANFTSDQRVTGFLRKLKENADSAAPAIVNNSKAIATSMSSGADVYSQAATKTEAASKKVTKELTAKQQALRALRGPTAEATSGFKAYAAADKALGASAAATGRQLADTEQKVGRLRGAYQGLASSGMIRMGVQVAGIMAAEYAIVSLVKHIADVEARADKVREKASEIAQAYDDLLAKGEAFKAPGDPANRAVEIKTGKDFFEAIDEGGLLKRGLRPQDQTFWDAIDKPYSKPVRFGDQDPFAFDPKIAGKRWQDQKLGQIGRDPNMLASVLRELPQYASENSLNGDEIAKLTAAIEALVGTEKMNAAKEILSKEKVVQGSIPGPSRPQDQIWKAIGDPYSGPNVKDLRNPWSIPSFNINQYGDGKAGSPLLQPKKPDPIAKTPITPDSKLKLYDLFGNMPKTPPSTPPIDLKKAMDVPKAAEVLSTLNQPIASNVTNLTNLIQPSASNVTNFTDMMQPTAQTSQSFATLVNPANQMPGSFGRINTSVGNVVGSLDTLSQSIASWRPPATGGGIGIDGKPVPVMNPGGAAVGAFVGHSGLAFIHANEEVVPAGLRRHRDTLGQNLVSSLTNVRNNRQEANQSSQSIINIRNTSSAGGITPQTKLTTINGNDRFGPQPESKGLYPQFSATKPTSNAASGTNEFREVMGSFETRSVTRNERESSVERSENRGASGNAQPINVTVSQAPINITLNDAGSKEIARLERILESHRQETGRIAVDAVRREIGRGRQRA